MYAAYFLRTFACPIYLYSFQAHFIYVRVYMNTVLIRIRKSKEGVGGGGGKQSPLVSELSDACIVRMGICCI